MAGIARQISSCQPRYPLLPPTVASYEERRREWFASGSLRLDKSCELIIQLAEQYPMTTIVIDVLDECDPLKRVDLLEGLQSIL